jgi:SET domain-containing protein
MNHSFDPNCDDGSGSYTVAIRDIAEGEELTCDYRLFDRDILTEELARYR